MLTRLLQMTTGCACLLFLVVFASPATAATYWQYDPATPGDWFHLGNWDDGLPTSSVDAYIDNNGTAQIASAGAECGNLYLGHTAGQSGTRR